MVMNLERFIQRHPRLRRIEGTHPIRNSMMWNVVSPTGSPVGVGRPQGRNNAQWIRDVSKSKGHTLRMRAGMHNLVDKRFGAPRKRADLRLGLDGERLMNTNEHQSTLDAILR